MTKLLISMFLILAVLLTGCGGQAPATTGTGHPRRRNDGGRHNCAASMKPGCPWSIRKPP